MFNLPVLSRAVLVAGAIAAPLALFGAGTASATPFTPYRSDVCVAGPLGFVQGCVDIDAHRWWDGNRWWPGDRAWEGDEWHRWHDGPGWDR
jgi:hypothetical protein